MLHSKQHPKIFWWMWLPLLVMLGLLAFIYLSHLNRSLFLQMNHLSAYAAAPFWAGLTIFGDGLIIAALLFPFIRKRPDVLLAAIFAMIIMAILVNVTKDLAHIPRPPKILDHATFTIIGPAHKSRSFPSGHTATIFCYVGVWIFSGLKNRYKALLFLLAIFVGLSRISVGVHWPADVAAGASIGWISAFCGVMLARLFHKQRRLLHILLAFLLAAATIDLIFFYSTGYACVNWLRVLVGSICLIFGSIATVRLLFPHFFDSLQK